VTTLNKPETSVIKKQWKVHKLLETEESKPKSYKCNPIVKKREDINEMETKKAIQKKMKEIKDVYFGWE
jgi:hypothetical protein